MKLSAALQYIDEAGMLPKSWGAVVLVRNEHEPADSPRAYTMVPIVGVRADDTRKRVELLAADDAEKRPVKELKATELVSRLKRLAAEHAGSRLFAAHPRKSRVRIVGIASDPELDALLFLQWYKGCEREL